MIDVGWAVPLIAGAIVAVVIGATALASFGYYLKCLEVDRLRQQLDEWQGPRYDGLQHGWRSSEWDTMCAEMKADATGTTTGSTSDDDE